MNQNAANSASVFGVPRQHEGRLPGAGLMFMPHLSHQRHALPERGAALSLSTTPSKRARLSATLENTVAAKAINGHIARFLRPPLTDRLGTHAPLAVLLTSWSQTPSEVGRLNYLPTQPIKCWSFTYPIYTLATSIGSDPSALLLVTDPPTQATRPCWRVLSRTAPHLELLVPSSSALRET